MFVDTLDRGAMFGLDGGVECLYIMSRVFFVGLSALMHLSERALL